MAAESYLSVLRVSLVLAFNHFAREVIRILFGSRFTGLRSEAVIALTGIVVERAVNRLVNVL